MATGNILDPRGGVSLLMTSETRRTVDLILIITLDWSLPARNASWPMLVLVGIWVYPGVDAYLGSSGQIEYP